MQDCARQLCIDLKSQSHSKNAQPNVSTRYNFTELQSLCAQMLLGSFAASRMPGAQFWALGSWVQIQVRLRGSLGF